MNIFGRRYKLSRDGRRDPDPGSAAVARNRLMVLLAHEGGRGATSGLLSLLQESIVEAIRRHVMVGPEKIHVTMHRGASISTLAIEVEIPA